MANEGEIKKPTSGMTVGEAWSKVAAKIEEWFRKIEGRLSSFSKTKLIALTVGVGIVSICAGIGLGFVLNPYQPTPTPGGDLSTPPDTTPPEIISQSGVLRKFKTSQDGIDYYLEKQDGSKVLLTASAQIDVSLLAGFEGLGVTVEGTVSKTADGSKDVLSVEKIWLKQ